MALAVPLSRFTSRVGGGSAFFVRPHRDYDNFQRHIVRDSGDWSMCSRSAASWSVRDFIHCSRLSCALGLGIGLSSLLSFRWHSPIHHAPARGTVADDHLVIGDGVGSDFIDMRISMNLWPNKSPEPTAVGAVSSAVAVQAASRRWLSFFR